MAEVWFVLGGCRSGKSSYAMKSVQQAGERDKVFVATSSPQDQEMRERIERHRRERGPEWRTVEAQMELPEAVRRNGGEGTGLLVDCLGMWVSNLLVQGVGEEEIRARFRDLCESFRGVGGRICLVSNEVGCGIVPEGELGRLFRDLLGQLNQEVAAAADKVTWMVAGLPVAVKGGA